MAVKFLDNTGLSYFWSKIKAWCSSTFAAIAHTHSSTSLENVKHSYMTAANATKDWYRIANANTSQIDTSKPLHVQFMLTAYNTTVNNDYYQRWFVDCEVFGRNSGLRVFGNSQIPFQYVRLLYENTNADVDSSDRPAIDIYLNYVIASATSIEIEEINNSGWTFIPDGQLSVSTVPTGFESRQATCHASGVYNCKLAEYATYHYLYGYDISANTTLSTSNSNHCYRILNCTGTITVTVPSWNSSSGWFFIKNNGTGVVTVHPASTSVMFDNVSADIVLQPGEFIRLVCQSNDHYSIVDDGRWISQKADDSTVVHTTGNESISGEKSFYDKVVISKSNSTDGDSGILLEGAGQSYIISAVDTSCKKGTMPDENKFWGIEFYGEDHSYYYHRIGLLETFLSSVNNKCQTSLIAYDCTTNNNTNYCAIRAGVDGSGNKYTEAPTPVAGDSSTNIATTAYVQGEISGFAADSDVVHKTENETIAGTKTFSSGIVFGSTAGGYRPAATSGVHLSGGSAYNKGGRISMFGESNATTAGYVQIRAHGGSTTKILEMRPDGTLTWDGQAIQTASDERLKTPLFAVPDEVLDAWEDVQWGQFQYLDAVERKGAEAARQHLGLIAQRINAVFEARGLDACAYGILCHEEHEATEDEPAVDIWMVRYTEALAIEAAFQRRKADRLEARIRAVEEMLK